MSDEPLQCEGLEAGCLVCRDMYLKTMGDRAARCMVCDHRHHPWEAHILSD